MTIDIGSLGSLSWLATLSRAHLAEAQDGRMLKYFGPLVPEEKGHLEQQVRFRRKLDARRAAVLDRHCSWPTELVSENGKTVGYLMRRSASFVPLLSLGDTDPLAAASALIAAAAALEPLGLELGGDPRYDWGFSSGAEFLACDEWPMGGVASPFAWAPDPRLHHLAPMRRHALLGLAIWLVLDRPLGRAENASYREIAQACVPLWRALADAGTEAPDIGAWRRVLGLDDAADDALLSTATSGGFADVLSMSSGRGGSRLARSLRAMALHHVLAENWPEPTRIELNGSELHVNWRWPRSSEVTGAEVQLVSQHLGGHKVVAEAFVEREGSSLGEQVLSVPSQLDVEASSVRLASASRGPEGWIVGRPLVTSLVNGEGG